MLVNDGISEVYHKLYCIQCRVYCVGAEAQRGGDVCNVVVAAVARVLQDKNLTLSY